eukprot:scaffold250_cov390-Prasinococcus_capsulatus_cf.AAC.4
MTTGLHHTREAQSLIAVRLAKGRHTAGKPSLRWVDHSSPPQQLEGYPSTCPCVAPPPSTQVCARTRLVGRSFVSPCAAPGGPEQEWPIQRQDDPPRPASGPRSPSRACTLDRMNE